MIDQKKPVSIMIEPRQRHHFTAVGEGIKAQPRAKRFLHVGHAVDGFAFALQGVELLGA